MCRPEINIPLFPNSSFTYNWALEIENTLQGNQPCPVICESLLAYPEGSMVTRFCSPADEDDEDDVADWLDADFSSCNYNITAFMLCEATQVHPLTTLPTVSLYYSVQCYGSCNKLCC